MPRDIVIRPVTRERWSDLERLFGPSGAYSGCWCMWWRQTAAEFDAGHGQPNRQQMKELVEGDTIPGLIAYVGDEPAGWVSVAPREQFGRIERSPVLKPIDEREAWAIVCFFIHREHRSKGIASALLRGAVDFASSKGAHIVEGYASDPKEGGTAADLFTGTVSMFEAAGFVEAARRRPTARRIMRWHQRDTAAP